MAQKAKNTVKKSTKPVKKTVSVQKVSIKTPVKKQQCNKKCCCQKKKTLWEKIKEFFGF